MSDRTLYTVLDEAARSWGKAPALYQPAESKGAKNYRMYDWVEYREAAREIACGLRSIGVQKGDMVALDSETRAEFYLADAGILANGSIAAALYTSLPAAELVGALNTIEPRAVFVENAATLKALRNAGALGSPMHWILLTGETDGALTLSGLRERGRRAMEEDPGLFDRIHSEVSPQDLAILYMTSGATGEPKMGLVTHRSVVSNVDMGPSVLPIGPEDSTLAFLPSAHIAQRVVMEFLPIRCGVPVYFSEGLTKMPLELRSVKPTFLLAPPRVWERVHASISTEIKKRPAITRKLFYTALGLGLRASHLRHEGQPIPGWMKRFLGLADKVVFAKIRERLGGRIRIALSGAAPLGRDLAQFYEAIGMPLSEGYGLTEGGVLCLNPIGNPRAGSIGKLLPGVEMKLGEDGELLMRSPTLFSAYFKDPAATASVLKDGWLHTGDIAEVKEHGFIYITGRKKEVLVASNGKKIYPARIENLFKVEPIINQVVLLGDRQPYVTALFTLNPSAAESVDGMEGWKGKSPAELAAAPPVVQEVKQAV
ncbi:MAG: AMP-dependent synthetase/ligase, partial [Bryobacteraceae bacterium]